MKKNSNKRITFVTIFAGLAGIILGITGAILTNQQFLANKTAYPQLGIGGGPIAEEAVKAEDVIEEWPSRSQRVAREIISKYGQPDVIKTDRFIWHENSPWEKTIIYRDGVEDNLPGSQSKVLEQSINYRLPDDNFNELVAYDSSVVADRTKGELMARSDNEAMNFLIINLANDIMMDSKPLDEVRNVYSDLQLKYINGENVPYVQKLQFNTPPNGKVREPGESIMQ